MPNVTDNTSVRRNDTSATVSANTDVQLQKALKKEHHDQPTAVPENFALTGHSINDLQIIPLELINSTRDMIRKARESYLITVSS